MKILRFSSCRGLATWVYVLLAAQSAGATDTQLKAARDFQRQAQWRLDFVSAENSMGFHAPQEAARILAEAIDYARQGEVAAARETKFLPAARVGQE